MWRARRGVLQLKDRNGAWVDEQVLIHHDMPLYEQRCMELGA